RGALPCGARLNGERFNGVTNVDNRNGESKRSPSRRLVGWGLYAGYLAAVVFVGVKLFGYFVLDIPVTRSANADDVWRYYYKELWKSGAVDSQSTAGDGRMDVLLLGASVLEQAADPLEDALKKQVGDNVRVYNLCKSAHTTRDSALKYSRLREKQFDLIVVYHGINDSRMNCVPKADFRDDYSHCRWYAGFDRRLKAGMLSVRGITAGFNRGKIALGEPDDDARAFGRDVKTETAFRRNVEQIVKAAAARKTPVVLMTFATWIPDGYSEEKFRMGKLPYGSGRFELPVEVWGDPPNVLKTVNAHNAVIRDIAGRYDNVRFVDQQKLLPGNGSVFSDVCHLTDDGCEQFAANVVAAIRRTPQPP
ncbi:MAG: SGNH/GDSL hydrolase family protein, partial [Planctomycetaceae bacterium]